MAVTIPDFQIALLREAERKAVVLALRGRPGRGYAFLAAGLHYAQDLGVEGPSWAAALIQGYQQALDRYVARFGLRLD